jgi:excisionase family DNA binding protein
MADPTLYTAIEVAELLRLNLQVVQRKLQAGAIPGYRMGREWRVDREQLLTWLDRQSNQRAQKPAARIEETFLTEDGRLRAIPAQRSKRDVILDRVAASFDPARTYTEREVSAIIRPFHDDVATIRRELVAAKKLVRTKNGIYKRTTAGPKPALRHS